MSTNFIYCSNYNDALKQTIAKINARTVDLNIRHLIIVPERYTLLAEKILYEQTMGSFDVEVLSLSRLFYRMQIKTPLLSREGAIMFIRSILRFIKLECFYRSSSHRGFCEKLYDAINDFAASGVSPEDIPSSSPKLRDLKKIYTEYLEGIKGRFVDNMGKLNLIAREAATNIYLNNVHIYVTNFDYVDKATRLVFDSLKKRALSYTESFVKVKQVSDIQAEKYCGDGAIAVKEVAKRLRYLAYLGVDMSEMAVITGNADKARIKRIFTEFDLPCFILDNKRLNDYTLYDFLSMLFACVKNMKRDNVLELSKNVYAGIDKKNSDDFEIYVSQRLIDYAGFQKEFDDPSCEKTRKKLIGMISYTAVRLKSVNDADEFYRSVNDIFERFDVRKITEERFGTDAPVEKILSLISLMKEVTISGNIDFILSVFDEGAKATKMSELPYNGGIIVGDPASFRGGKFKFMAVIGFDDGFLPQIYDDSSLIGDDEKALFDQMERVDQINARYENELYAALSSSEFVFITYTQPSGMMSALFNKKPQLSGVLTGNDLLDAGGMKHATELMIRLINFAETADESDYDFINALYAVTKQSYAQFMPKRVSSIKNAERLFFANGTTSISQLQSYFRCPFGHFAEYGLKLKKRDTGEFSPIDVGSFLHLIVENVIKSGDYTNIALSVDKAVERIIKSGGKYAVEANHKIINELKSEAISALEIYIDHLYKSEFISLGQEIEFQTELSNVKLVGKIDMADQYNGYIRLIDYKTGSNELKPSDIYYGKKIQLPLYMSAAVNHGFKPAAMFNFPLNYKWLGGKFDHRFSGFMLGDKNIALAVDNTVENGESDVFAMKIKQSGEVCGCVGIVDDDEMDELISYAVELSENAVEEIKSGYIAASPCGNACEYCDYKCLCLDKKIREEIGVDKRSFCEVKNDKRR